MKAVAKKRVVSRKKQSKKVKRNANGQIVAGSAGNGGGRPKGARSTGKKPANTKKSNSSVNPKKSVSSIKKPNKFVAKKHTSTAGVKRAKNGRLLKGTKGISPGRPAGNSSIDELNCAIAEAERQKGRGAQWLVDLVKRSWDDSQLAVAILSRKFPALKAIEIIQPESVDDSIREAADIRKEMIERFGTQ